MQVYAARQGYWILRIPSALAFYLMYWVKTGLMVGGQKCGYTNGTTGDQ